MQFDQWRNRKPVKEILGNKSISTAVEKQIIEVLSKRTVSNDRIKNIAYWVKYDVTGNYLERFDSLISHPKNDSSSKEIFILRYGEKEGLKRFEEKTKKCVQSKESMIEKFGLNIGLQKWQEYKNKLSVANSLEGYIIKYGVVQGNIEFNNRRERNSGNLTLDRKIELFGESLGLEKFCIMTEKLRKRHSLKNYIDLYGFKLGQEKWNKLCSLRSYKSSLDFYIHKYGLEEGKKRIKIVKNNSKSFNNYSKISLKLFEAISDYSNLFGENEVAISLTLAEYNKCNRWTIKPDFIMGNKIIEFYGDLFHGNPKLFTNTDLCHPFNNKINAGMIWDDDYNRNLVLIERGYELLIVWESDFRKSPSDVINNCISFLKED